MLLSALLLLPSMASALKDAGYGTQSKRDYTPITAELSDLRNIDQITYLASNDSLVRHVMSVRTNATLIWQIPPRRRPGSPKTPDECPPCFNCLLPAFNCGNSGECNEYDGQCRCPPGFGGQDCLTPRKLAYSIRRRAKLMTVCGALTDGDERYPRPDGELCHCKEGWGGINCNGRSAQSSNLAVLTR